MAIDFNKLKKGSDPKIKVTPVLANLTVGKPSATAFFQIRDGEGWEPVILSTFTPDSRSKDSQPYLVYDEFAQVFEEKKVLVPARFYMYMVYGSNVMKIDLISQRVDKSGNLNRYHTSRMACYEEAKTKWVQMHAQEEGGYYVWGYAESNLPAPVWPEKPENLLAAIDLAFKGFIIDDAEHPEIKKLKGKL